MKYSVIVAVYNLEQYIEECINSILEQTYKDFEIIIVDDGSTDRSLEICKMLQTQDYRINVIATSHTGVSETRNVGIENAKGEFLFFVDGDDFIEATYIMEADKVIADNNIDILITNHYYLYDNNTHKIIEKCMYPLNLEVESKKIYILEYIINNGYMIPGGISFNIYRRAFLMQYQCFFQTGIQWFEDLDFFLQVMSHNPEYEVTDIKYYYYRRNRSGSAIASATTQKILDKMQIIRKWYNYVENMSYENPFYSIKYWLQREYYVNFAFCVPINSKDIDYCELSKVILSDSKIWEEKYRTFGKNICKFGLKQLLPFIKIKEYGKLMLGIR